MKTRFVSVIICGMLTSSAVLAEPPATPPGQCSTSKQLSASEIRGLLSDKTLCANTNTEKWQELHVTGGILKDYKKGPSDPVDPTGTVGSWSTTESGNNGVNQDDRLVHTYGGTSFSWKVFDNCDNTSYRLVGTLTYTFTVQPSGPCP